MKNYVCDKKGLIFLVLCILFLVMSILLFNMSFSFSSSKSVSYDEKGSVSYQVCLKENNFYDSECLNEDMSYVASLIKSIPLKFDYSLVSNVSSLDIKPKYEVYANLLIVNSDNNTNYYQKRFELVKKTDEGIIKGADGYHFSRDVDINYDYYNDIANQFKSQYGVAVKSYLNVSFVVYSLSSDLKITVPSIATISIPLSEKSVSISMESNDINSSKVMENSLGSFVLSNVLFFVFGILILIFALVFGVGFIKVVNSNRVKPSIYDKYIRKLLKEYDRLIVETKSFPFVSDYNVLRITDFDELLDVRDNLKLPIMYYEVIPHRKSHFYILQDYNLYLFTVKSSVMDDE